MNIRAFLDYGLNYYKAYVRELLTKEIWIHHD